MAYRILVVDDNPQMRSLLRHMLKAEGYEVDEAEDGVQAIDMAAEMPPDLLITDIVMPGKEGFETIIDMRGAHPGLKIIAISGGRVSGANDYLKYAEELGAHRALAKPIKKELLLACLKELLTPGK